MTEQELHIAYTSRLAPGHEYTVFGEICRGARARNVERGIAGVLLFDGQRFFQWLYGRPEPTAALMDAIALDARHTAVRVCLKERMPALTLDAQWRSGFVEPEALDTIETQPPGDAARMLEAIGRLIAQADLEPPVVVGRVAR